jgi:lysophospholipase L1-like esterase
VKNLILSLFIIASLASCKKAVKSDPIVASKAYKVLILGNSITYTPPSPNILWYGNWGMAASAEDKDYVHLLGAHLKAANDSSTVTVQNIGEFEFYFDAYNIDANLKKIRDAKPDILIMRIGESVTRNQDADLFEKRYVDLLNYFKATNPQIKILAVGSILRFRDMPNTVMSKYSKYISLSVLNADQTNFAYGLFANTDIQGHPSDKGMLAISNLIWDALKEMIY